MSEVVEQVAALSDHAREEIDLWVARFPADQKRSAVISALKIVQHENQGYLNGGLMDAVAEYLDLQPIQVYEIASFYSMFETKKVGRHSISVCTNVSCMLCGSDDIVAYIEKKLGVKTGGSTFKNPVGDKAWKLIEDAGCRGLKVGAAKVSEKHCNFLINTDEASAKNLEDLGEAVRRTVLKKSGVSLKWEIERIGDA